MVVPLPDEPDSLVDLETILGKRVLFLRAMSSLSSNRWEITLTDVCIRVSHRDGARRATATSALLIERLSKHGT